LCGIVIAGMKRLDCRPSVEPPSSRITRLSLSKPDREQFLVSIQPFVYRYTFPHTILSLGPLPERQAAYPLVLVSECLSQPQSCGGGTVVAEYKLSQRKLLALRLVGEPLPTISAKFATDPLQKIPHKYQDEPPTDRSGTVCRKKMLAKRNSNGCFSTLMTSRRFTGGWEASPVAEETAKHDLASNRLMRRGSFLTPTPQSGPVGCKRKEK
jgi:hypothetical protein